MWATPLQLTDFWSTLLTYSSNNLLVFFKEIKEEQDSRVKTEAGETQDSIFRE